MFLQNSIENFLKPLTLGKTADCFCGRKNAAYQRPYKEIAVSNKQAVDLNMKTFTGLNLLRNRYVRTNEVENNQ